MKIRITNSSISRRSVYLEPLGEKKSLEKGEEIYIQMGPLTETLGVSDIPEFSLSDDAITIFYTSAVVIDWA